MADTHTSFTLALGCNISFVAQQQRGHQISVLSTRWDSVVDRFLPPRKWSIPISGNMELVAAESVANYASGEIEAYIVLANCSTVSIGVIDLSQDKFATVALITHDEDSSAKLECLLTNGPTAIAKLPGKILVMHPHHVIESKHDGHSGSHKLWTEHKVVEPQWLAYVLNLDEIHMGCDGRLLFAHDGNTSCTPEVIMGIYNSFMDIMPPIVANNNLKRSQVEWQYIRLNLYSLGCYLLDVVQNNSEYSMKQAWMRMYQKTDSLFCNEIFPADLNPFTISCMQLVPADPSSLTYAASWLGRPSSNNLPDVIIATHDYKVLKCRHGKIIANACLKNILVSLTFAVVAQGQGVLVAQLGGPEKNVIALCCETLQQLEVWSNVTNVVVGDFELVGHDQILLVKSQSPYKPGPFSLEDLLCSMIITDLKRSGLVGPSDPQQELKFADRSEAIDHKGRHIQAVARFLESRIEAGILREQQLQLQMEKKKHILESSCKLMEGITTRHSLGFVEENSLLAIENSLSTRKGSEPRLVQIEQAYHALQGRTWFVVIGVRSRVPRGLLLKGATVLLTTIKGQIAGSTSTVRNIVARDKLYKFVVAVRLQNFMAFTCFPVVNIMLKAWLTCEEMDDDRLFKSLIKEHGKSMGNIIREKHRCLHTEWLGRICIEQDDLIRPFILQGVLHTIREVGENQAFIFRPKAEYNSLTLLSEIKSVLHMDYSSKEYSNLQATGSRICVLLTRRTYPFGEAYVYIFGDIALLTLNAEDSEFLSSMQAQLISHFRHQYDVCQYRNFENMLGSILAFTGAFFRELEVKSSSCAKRGEVGQDLSHQTVQEYHKDLELSTDEACLHIIPAASF